MRVFGSVLVGLLLITIAPPEAGASHDGGCAQSHDYFVADDAFIDLDEESRDFGVIDVIELTCDGGWGRWPQLTFDSPSGDPCWAMKFKSSQVVELTILTACLTPPDVSVSTLGTVYAQ